jgi:hypothetical protein
MSTVKLALKSMSVPEKIQFARRVADALEAAVDTFPDMPTDFDELRDNAYNLENAYNNAAVARAQAKLLTAQTADFEAYLSSSLMLDARYVQNVSGGDPRIIGLAGMSASLAPTPVGPLPAPRNLSIAAGRFAGQLTVKWTSVRKARSYLIETTTVFNTTPPWRLAAIATRAKATLEGLTTGTQYWIRIAALGAAGPGAWSEAATHTVA